MQQTVVQDCDRMSLAAQQALIVWTNIACLKHCQGGGYLVGAASRDEDPLPLVLLKVPGLHPILLLQLLQVLPPKEEVLQHKAATAESLSCLPCPAFIIRSSSSFFASTAAAKQAIQMWLDATTPVSQRYIH